MDIQILLQVIALGLIQGITEFLPISSSAHLLLPSALFGFKEQGVAFDVACHVGTLMAVMAYFRTELKGMFNDSIAYLKSRVVTPNVIMAWYLICGTIPVCIAGYFVDKYLLDQIRESAVAVIATTTVVFAVILYIADAYAVKHCNVVNENNMGFKRAMLIAISQIFAFVPGTSRSGISMIFALFCGLTRKATARYSFLLSIPLILAAGLHSGLKVMKETTESVDYLYIGIGLIVSYISAYYVIKFFIKWIEKIGMTPFVIYRLILGLILFAVLVF